MILKNKLKKIIEAIKDTDIKTIEVSSFWGDQKIKLSKDANIESINVVKQNSVIIETIDTTISSSDNNISDDIIKEDDVISKEKPILNSLIEVKAPLVGTFYLSPKPGEPQFVNVGDNIIEGQSICVIEAMKIFNEIESEHEGEVVEILIQDGEPVEYDQVLFTLNPK